MAAPGRTGGQRACSFQESQGGAYGCHGPADSPVAAHGPGHLEPFPAELLEHLLQIKFHAGVMEGRQQAGPVQHMVLRPMDPDEILSCHMTENGPGDWFPFLLHRLR